MEESSSNIPRDSEGASPNEKAYMECIYTIKCIDLNIEATDEILAQFDLEGDVEYNNVVIFNPATLLEPPVPENL